MNNRIANDLIRYAELVEDGALISPEEMNCASVMRLAAEYLAQPEQEPVAWAWDEGYRQGVEDERTSEANIGIAGFGAKVEPARQNPYGATQPQRPSRSDINPLTIDQIASIAIDRSKPDGIIAFVRAIEAAHGIKE